MLVGVLDAFGDTTLFFTPLVAQLGTRCNVLAFGWCDVPGCFCCGGLLAALALRLVCVPSF